jgi:hypothetical protein
MGVIFKIAPAATGSGVGSNVREPEVIDELTRLARSAEGVLATRSDLHGWLTCMVHERVCGVAGRPVTRSGGLLVL